MKRLTIIAIIIFTLFAGSVVYGRVISRIKVDLYSVYFYTKYKLSPTSIDYVITNFGPGNIRFLKSVDIVLDNEGRVAGVQFIYQLPDGFKRKTFLTNIIGWTFKKAKRRGISKKIVLRLVTTEELNIPW